MNAALDSRQPSLKTPSLALLSPSCRESLDVCVCVCVLTFCTSAHAFLCVPTCAMYVCRCLVQKRLVPVIYHVNEVMRITVFISG